MLSIGGYTATFRIGKCDLFTSPQAQISPLKLLRHKRIELLSGTKPSADLREDTDKNVILSKQIFSTVESRIITNVTGTSFSY